MTTITLRMDADLKQNLQKIAKKLWVSLNQLINLKMREFDENRVLNLDLREDLEVESIEPILGSEDFIHSKDYKRWATLLSQI